MLDGAPQNDENSEAALGRFAFVYTVERSVRWGAGVRARAGGAAALTALVCDDMHGRATVEDGVRVAWHQIAL